MGYMSIENLYKAQEILQEKELWALEKIHGTSCHFAFKDGQLRIYSGGIKHETFISAMIRDGHVEESRGLANCNPEKLEAKLSEVFGGSAPCEVIVYGEGYGGSCQRMHDVYGPDIRFVAFDVKIDGSFVDVPRAAEICRGLGFEFVNYTRIQCSLSAIDFERDRESIQAVRNGVGDGKWREGVVLRPITEKVDRRGNRLIVKHKRAEYGETKTPREVDPNKKIAYDNAQAVADEWVTENRLEHVLQHLQERNPELEIDITFTRDVINEMIEDVKRESEGELEWSKEVEKAIGRSTALLFKRKVTTIHA